LIVGGEPRESGLVQRLAEEYIGRESCIILLTIACESMFVLHFRCVATLKRMMLTADFENQIAHRLAAKFDPSGARTIGISTLYSARNRLLICVGVLTKPDRISPGDEAPWISRIQSGEMGGGIEYFSVKNPDSQDIRNGITYEQARENEAEFFSTRAPWSNLEWLYQRRLGTDKLTRRLGQVLSNLISKRQVLFTFGLGVTVILTYRQTS
jgi:hypothetical protein